MKKFIKIFPLHAFLIGPAIIFFLFAHNFYVVPADSTSRSFIMALLIGCFLFGASFLLFKKNKIKAGVFTTITYCSIFSYGLIYDLFESLYYNNLWPFSNIHRYLIIFYVISLTILFIFIRRSSRNFLDTTKALNAFTYMLLVFNLVILISKSSASLSYKQGVQDTDTSYYPSRHHDSLPDIYYIILDGYANDSILSSLYSYSSNSLTSFLQKNNFYVSRASRANYLVTVESLGSSLNYSYQGSSRENVRGNSISKNEVCKYLKNKSYRIVHIRSGYHVTRDNYYADTVITLQNLSEFERTLLRYTIFRLDDLTGYVHYLTLKEQLATIRNIPKIGSPKFSFIHIVSPHPPYTCDEQGKFRTKAKIINAWWETREEYLAQLKYINSEIESFISEILKASKIPPIIVVQSDHGPWVKDNSLTNIYNARSLILNSYHIPYPWKTKFYSTITPVNTFPIIFNNLFHDSIPLQKDMPMDSIGMKKYRQTQAMLED